jgi:hypothetical protein
MAQPQRACNDMGLNKTVAWLSEWYGDTSDLLVEYVPIHCPDVAALSRVEAEQLDCLRSKNQSELHTYLKFAALKWLEEKSSYPETIASEVICYSPIEELCEGRICMDAQGREIDIRTPQVLYDNPDNFPLSYGHVIRADLHSFDISVEVGGTQPFNLLTPLLDRLVDQAVWLPYPWGKDTVNFQHPPGGLGTARAYAIRFQG